jgi:hypothetical protein
VTLVIGKSATGQFTAGSITYTSTADGGFAAPVSRKFSYGGGALVSSSRKPPPGEQA